MYTSFILQVPFSGSAYVHLNVNVSTVSTLKPTLHTLHFRLQYTCSLHCKVCAVDVQGTLQIYCSLVWDLTGLSYCDPTKNDPNGLLGCLLLDERQQVKQASFKVLFTISFQESTIVSTWLLSCYQYFCHPWWWIFTEVVKIRRKFHYGLGWWVYFSNQGWVWRAMPLI